MIEQGQKNKGKDKYRENMILNVEYAFAFENREHYMKKENKEVTFCMDESGHLEWRQRLPEL